MSIKGFSSLVHNVADVFNNIQYKSEQLYATLRRVAHEQAALMVAPVWLSVVSTANSLDASGSTNRVLSITGHSLRRGMTLRFTSGSFVGEEVQIQEVIDANTVLLAQRLSSTPSGSETFNSYRPMTPTLDGSGQIAVVEGITTVVDNLDDGSFAPTGANAIPASSAAPLEVVSSLAAAVTRVQVISDIGEFINLYDDSAGTNLLCHLVLTPDESVDIDIPAGTTLYIRNAKNATIDDANSIISMNFIG